MEQYALVDDDKVLTQVWFSDIDLSSAEVTALKSAGITKAELSDYETVDPFAISNLNLAEQNDKIQTYIEAKRVAATELYTEYNQNLVDELLSGEEVFYVSRYSPVVLVKLSESSALALAKHSEIQMIADYESNNITNVDVDKDIETAVSTSTSIDDINTITRVNSIHTSSNYGYTGRGVKIGVSEPDLPDTSKFRNLNIRGIATDRDNVEVSSHATNVLDIVSRIAPDAEYYLGASKTSGDLKVIEALLDYGVNVITSSHAIGTPLEGCQYDVFEKWLDHIAYQHDVHFVQAAGNSGAGSTAGTAGPGPGCMAYNIVVVGNLDTKGNLYYYDDVINPGSSYYSGSTLANKPDICAPGTNIISSFYTDTMTGTSYAAPQVAGVIALMCEQRPALKTQQTTVKAILTASVNFDSQHGYTPSSTNYKKYGAGLLDCVGACYVVGGYRYTNSSIAYGITSKTHTFTVNSSDSRIRVSLAFNIRSTSTSVGDYHDTYIDNVKLGNLNIQVKDPNGKTVGSSTTTNNNVEIVDFKPTTTGTYSIVVQRVASTDDPAETVYYGLAWR